MPNAEVATALARAPLRVSLAGGGTDLPSYAERFGGHVVSFAIDRYVGVTVHPRSFHGTVRAALDGWDTSADVLGMANVFARAALRRAGVSRDVELSSFGDVPAGTGLGSSAAFTVALLHALAAAGGGRPDRRDLAEAASAVEMVDLARPVGKHDHYVSAFGGVCTLRIGMDGDVEVETTSVSAALESYIADRMLLFYTGETRDAERILAAQQATTVDGSTRTIETLHRIKDLVADMETAIREAAFDDVGTILDEHWQRKRRLSDRVSSPAIDALYARARAAGAQGGKILGAGGGGFLLLAAADGGQQRLRGAMSQAGVRELPFGLERLGSRAVRIGPRGPRGALDGGVVR